jgi:hypothetical protein
MYLILNLSGKNDILDRTDHCYKVSPANRKKSAKPSGINHIMREDLSRLLQNCRADIFDSTTGLIEQNVTNFSKYKTETIDNLIYEPTRTNRFMHFVSIDYLFLKFINMLGIIYHIGDSARYYYGKYNLIGAMQQIEDSNNIINTAKNDSTSIANYSSFSKDWSKFGNYKSLNFVVNNSGIPLGIKGNIGFSPIDADYLLTNNNCLYWQIHVDYYFDIINILDLYDLIITPFIPYILKYNMTSVAFYSTEDSFCNYLFPVNKQICTFLTKYRVSRG